MGVVCIVSRTQEMFFLLDCNPSRPRERATPFSVVKVQIPPDTHSKKKTTAVKAYKAVLIRFMSYKDDRAYSDAAAFSENDLLRITPDDVCRWMNFRAYGDPAPNADMKPVRARINSRVHKKSSLINHAATTPSVESNTAGRKPNTK